MPFLTNIKFVGALLLVLVLSTAWHAVQHANNSELATELRVAKQERDTAIKSLQQANTANERKDAQIAKLSKDLSDMAGKKRDVQKAADRAVANLALARKQRDAARRELADLTEKIYATDPACASWGAAPVCGPVTDSVRNRWLELQHRADGNGSRAGDAPRLRAAPGVPAAAAATAGPPRAGGP